MTNYGRLTIKGLLATTVEKFPEHNALAYVGEEPISYIQLNKKIQALIGFLEKINVKPGDRVAILSENRPEWGISYFAVTSMKAIAVPVLNDFTETEIQNILKHSGSKVLFISKELRDKFGDLSAFPCEYLIDMEDFSLLNKSATAEVYREDAMPEKTYDLSEDDTAAIIYTSGTTGKSKGVMLSHKNITSNAIASSKVQPINENDRFLSLLPLSHTYENTLGLILPIIFGASVYYIKERPVVQALVPAAALVKPTLILAVPLIMERIFRNKIKPRLTSGLHMKLLYKIPFMRRKMHAKAGDKLKETFGGKLKFFGIGGAKLDRIVEQFLIDADFPYSIGYGLSESAPLLAGAGTHQHRIESTGPAVEGVELKINDPNPKNGIGEIWAKGPNVMKGYYNEPEETKKILTSDGWLKTGDLGIFDEEGFLYIKGRSKNVIVRPNGENVYPEEIESLINNFRHVAESIVTEKKGKLVALVHFNMEELGKFQNHLQGEVAPKVEERIQELKEDLLHYVNSRVNRFSHLKGIYIQPKPFKKTPTHKIKRFLYN